MAYPTLLYGTDNQAYEIYNASGVFGNSRYPLGTQLMLQDGRKYRFSMAGASTLVPGNAITSVVPIATDVNLTAVATAAGARVVNFTHGAATVVANYFAEGYVVVSVTPGGGDPYKILDHLALTSSGADLVNLAPGNSVRTDLTTTSRVDLINHPNSRVIASPATTVAAVPVGVAISAPTTLRFCFLQTRGVCGVLTSGTAIAGNVVGTGLGTAGAVGPIAALATQPIFGTVVRAAATGAWSSIFLTIDG